MCPFCKAGCQLGFIPESLSSGAEIVLRPHPAREHSELRIEELLLWFDGIGDRALRNRPYLRLCAPFCVQIRKRRGALMIDLFETGYEVILCQFASVRSVCW